MTFHRFGSLGWLYVGDLVYFERRQFFPVLDLLKEVGFSSKIIDKGVSSLKTIILVGWFLVYSSGGYAYEKSDTFYVQVHDQFVKVLSPDQYKENLSVIVENKMNQKLLGKLVKGNGERVGFYSIVPQSMSSLDVVLKKQERLFFVPLSPSFQEVELQIGKKSYEIPPER